MDISWQDLLSALALVLVLEGILPFVSPARFKRAMLLILQQDEKVLRIFGLTIMLSGAALLYFVRA